MGILEEPPKHLFERLVRVSEKTIKKVVEIIDRKISPKKPRKKKPQRPKKKHKTR